jgi:molybdenum cofactor cytidylyltransferase
MGTSKQLLPLGNKTVIRQCVDTLASAGIPDVVVVCGAQHDACAEALHGTCVTLVKNEKQASEMADSARIGLRSVDSLTSAVFVCLADHPLVQRETLRAMLSQHRLHPDKIVIPAFQGKRGHPSLFPFSVISDIFFQPTLRDIVREDASRVLIVDVADEGVVLDMDTPQDYKIVADRYPTFAEAAGEDHVQ